MKMLTKMNAIDFSLQENNGTFFLKLQGGESWELNILLTGAEIRSLAEIRNTDWAARKTIKAGESANSAVFWTAENDTAIIMVGHDDETWDFAVSIPTILIDEIEKEVVKRQDERKILSLLPKGWFSSNLTKAMQLYKELQRELPSGHILHKRAVKVIAHREGTDDILCQHEDDRTHFTVIHLTWSGEEEVDTEHPYVECDGNFNDFLDY